MKPDGCEERNVLLLTNYFKEVDDLSGYLVGRREWIEAIQVIAEELKKKQRQEDEVTLQSSSAKQPSLGPQKVGFG